MVWFPLPTDTNFVSRRLKKKNSPNQKKNKKTPNNNELEYCPTRTEIGDAKQMRLNKVNKNYVKPQGLWRLVAICTDHYKDY